MKKLIEKIYSQISTLVHMAQNLEASSINSFTEYFLAMHIY